MSAEATLAGTELWLASFLPQQLSEHEAAEESSKAHVCASPLATSGTQALWESVGDGDGEVVPLCDAVGELVPLGVGVGEPEGDIIAPLSVGVGELVAENDAAREPAAVRVGEGEADVVALALSVNSGDDEPELDPLSVGVGEPVGDGEPERLGVAVGEEQGVAVGIGDNEAVALRIAEALGVGDAGLVACTPETCSSARLKQ